MPTPTYLVCGAKSNSDQRCSLEAGHPPPHADALGHKWYPTFEEIKSKRGRVHQEETDTETDEDND